MPAPKEQRAPESLRHTNRRGMAALESRWRRVRRCLTEGESRRLPVMLSGPGTEGATTDTILVPVEAVWPGGTF